MSDSTQQHEPPVRVVIVDDEEPVRTVMSALLVTDPRFEVVGTAADGEQAVEVCRERCPDVVLLDVRMPVLDGIDAIPGLRDLDPSLRIVMWSWQTDRMCEALEAGADAWVTKGSSWEEAAPVLLGETALEDADRS